GQEALVARRGLRQNRGGDEARGEHEDGGTQHALTVAARPCAPTANPPLPRVRGTLASRPVLGRHGDPSDRAAPNGSAPRIVAPSRNPSRSDRHSAGVDTEPRRTPCPRGLLALAERRRCSFVGDFGRTWIYRRRNSIRAPVGAP